MASNEQGRLSREATTVGFNPPIPILRVPLPASQEDDPSKGPFVLAFQDEHSWLTAWNECEVKIAERCVAGARMGCSINAAKKCRPPWWHTILPFFRNQEEKEACEEREMQNCLASAQSKCASYAEETCEGGFTDHARILDSETRKDYIDDNAVFAGKE
ncbi:hypothetical protein GOP47_0025865 [Adiantum capillus-veneris]|uniref:Uncharacterized protein n=1 Tax=Adiantum capillus-veneris TaxID=13818 RepID=A0A9D4Z4J1_ADICA|nr:hypothetical protein GOP47_0025865 [Adiantum capillus-veneris]